MHEDSQELLRLSVTGDALMPASSATVTLWASNSNITSTTGASHYKRLVINNYSSSASAANGLQIDESFDGTTWYNVVSYSISATTYTKSYVSVAAPYVRVRYVNSANTLTTWGAVVVGDRSERASQ